MHKEERGLTCCQCRSCGGTYLSSSCVNTAPMMSGACNPAVFTSRGSHIGQTYLALACAAEATGFRRLQPRCAHNS